MPAFNKRKAGRIEFVAPLWAVSVEPAATSSAGGRNSSMFGACAGVPSSAGALAGFGAASHKKAVPKNPATVAAAAPNGLRSLMTTLASPVHQATAAGASSG